MQKLNNTIYNRLLLQAEEAKEQGFEKLASAIESSVDLEKDEVVQYSYSELNNELYDGLWKLATNVIKYHNVNNIQAEKLHLALESLAEVFYNDVSVAMDLDPNTISSLEPKVFGQS